MKDEKEIDQISKRTGTAKSEEFQQEIARKRKWFVRFILTFILLVFIGFSLLYLYGYYEFADSMDLYFKKGCDVSFVHPYRLVKASLDSSVYKEVELMGFLNPSERTEITIHRVIRTGEPKSEWKRLFVLEHDKEVMKTLELRCDGRYVKIEFKGSRGKLRSLEESIIIQLKASHYTQVGKIEPPPVTVCDEDFAKESGGHNG